MKFVDLNAQFKMIEDEIRASIDQVLNHGQFILGPEVLKLEQANKQIAELEGQVQMEQTNKQNC